MRAVLVLFVTLIAARTASAEMIEKTGVFGGLKLTYKVALPPGYDAAQAYPAILVFTGGPQSLQMAERTITVDWLQEAERRRYIVISPGTPDGSLFFERADRVFPAFLDQILKDYRVRGGKLHVAGHSNGGLSAFHVAALYPRYFATLTGYPGLLDAGDLPRAAAIKPLASSCMSATWTTDGVGRCRTSRANSASGIPDSLYGGKESGPPAERPHDQSVTATVRPDRKLPALTEKGSGVFSSRSDVGKRLPTPFPGRPSTSPDWALRQTRQLWCR